MEEEGIRSEGFTSVKAEKQESLARGTKVG